MKTSFVLFGYSMKALGSLIFFFPILHTLSWDTNFFFRMDYLHTKRFYQYPDAGLLHDGMRFFFLIQNLQLLVFCMDGQKLVATSILITFLSDFSRHIIKVNYYIKFFSFVYSNSYDLPTLPAPVPYGCEISIINFHERL